MFRTSVIFLLAFLVALAASLLQPTSSFAAVEKPRYALVVGNADYSRNVLKNPINDARDMSAALRQLDFEVYDGFNLTRSQMSELLSRFNQNAKRNADVVPFYFAG